MFTLVLAATCVTALASSEPLIKVTTPGTVGAAASVEFKLRNLGEGEEVWGTGATWSHVPAWLSLTNTAHGSGYLLKKGSDIEFRCPAAAKECELIVFQYRCNGCSFVDGGLPAFLQGLGWTSFQCAPKFRVAGGSAEHPTLGFRMVAASDTTTVLTTEADAEFVAFALDVHHVSCDTFSDEASCDASSERCMWDSGACEFRVCGRGIVGPNPPAVCSQHCVGLDL